MTADELRALAEEWWECCGDIHEPLLAAADAIEADRTTVRAAALNAAAIWLAGIDPFPQGRQLLLESAEEFAAWIEEEQ